MSSHTLIAPTNDSAMSEKSSTPAMESVISEYLPVLRASSDTPTRILSQPTSSETRGPPSLTPRPEFSSPRLLSSLCPGTTTRWDTATVSSTCSPTCSPGTRSFALLFLASARFLACARHRDEKPAGTPQHLLPPKFIPIIDKFCMQLI